MMSDYHAKPTLVQLLRKLEELNRWERLGLELDLKPADLETIELEQRGNVENSKTKMLRLWLKNPSCSWEHAGSHCVGADERDESCS